MCVSAKGQCASVHRKGGAGDEAGFVTAEEVSGSGDFIRCAHAADRLGLGQLLEHFPFAARIVFGDEAIDEWGVDAAGHDRVAANAGTEKILRDRVSHGEHCSFAGRVGEAIPNGHLRESGRDVENNAAAFRRHVPQRGLRAVRDAVHVHALDAGEVLRGGGERVADVCDAGVVHEDVKALVTRDDAGEGNIHARGIAHIANLAMRAVAGTAEFSHGGVERGLLQVEDLDGGSVLSEAFRNGKPDPGGSSGDDGGFRGEVERGGVHAVFNIQRGDGFHEVATGLDHGGGAPKLRPPSAWGQRLWGFRQHSEAAMFGNIGTGVVLEGSLQFRRHGDGAHGESRVIN